MNTSISNGLFDRINRILNNKKGKNYDYSKLDAEGKKAELAKFVPEIEEANKHNKKLFKYLIKKLVNSNIPDIHFLQLLQLQTQAVKGFRASKKQ
jgi:mannitol/fructose-specific phosphotransferase system IIA component (Ntr-type)